MNSWNIIKTQFTRGKRAGSVGYLGAVHDGAMLAIMLLERLKDGEATTSAVNADPEVAEAILNEPKRRELKTAGVLSD